MDPFVGTGQHGVTLETEDLWKERCGQTAPASVNVNAELSEDGTTVSVKATVLFPIEPPQDEYKVEFVLLADSLRDEKWVQVNYFTGQTPYAEYEEMRQFVDGGKVVAGLWFNDVVVASSRLTGQDAVLDGSQSVNTPVTVEYAFDLDEVKNSKGNPVIQDKRNLKSVVLLVNGSGEIVNANRAKVNSDRFASSGISGVTGAGNPTEKTLYDLSGRRLSVPKKGVNIVKCGNGRTVKVIVD